MGYEIVWNEECECFVWWHDGAGMTLEASTAEAAQEEVQAYVDQGIFPSIAFAGITFDEIEDDMDGDHASALAAAGFGTDEDYGCHELFFD